MAGDANRSHAGHDHSGHDRGGGHGHYGRSHGVSTDADRGNLAITLGLLVAFMTFEVAVGVISHSRALLSDAVHMLTDAGAIALSLLVFRWPSAQGQAIMALSQRRSRPPKNLP